MGKEKNHVLLCKYSYIIFAISGLMQFSITLMLLGMLAMTISLILLYAQRAEVRDTPLESHFQWLIRTFWIGGGVYLPVVTVIAFCIIYPNLDISLLYDAIASGQVTSIEEMGDAVMSQNKWLFTGVFAALGLPFIAWWLYRCWKGYRLLEQQKSIVNATSWL